MFRLWIVVLILGFLQVFAQDRGDFIVAYEDAASQTQLEFAKFLQQQGFLENLVNKLNQTIALPNNIGVVAAPCGQPNAYWAPEQETLVICYDLFEYMSEVFRGTTNSDQELIQKILGAVEFIFYHELGHALIDTFEIPFTGRQEDAVDQFSSILLLNQGKADSALAGASFFVSGSGGSQTPYWDEHSIDEQRFYDIVCLVFGSNPEAHSQLIQRESVFGMGGGGILPKQRAARCPQNYKEISSSWNRLIEVYVPSVNAQPAIATKTGPQVSVAEATNKGSYSDSFSGQLKQGDQRLQDGQYYDVYDIQLSKGQEVTFELSSKDFDTYIVVTGPDQEVYFNDDSPENIEDGYVSTLTLPITQTGTYSIGVSSYEAGETGNYNVGIILENGAYDETVAGTLEQGDQKYQSGQYFDLYEHSFEKGQSITVTLSAIDFDAYLIVTSPSGEEFVNDDYENQFGLARVDFAAKESGVYKISATSYGEAERGAYQLSVSDGTKKIAPNQGGVKTTMDENSLMGSLSTGDTKLQDGSYVDYYTLEVSQGERISASVMSADFEAYIGLVKPNGEIVEANRSDDGRSASLEITADQGGVWYAVVTSATPGQTGNYLVSIR